MPYESFLNKIFGRTFRLDNRSISHNKLLPFERLEDLLRSYSQQKQLQVSWDRFRELPLNDLVNFLAMHLPLGVEEKQTLVEAQTIDERARTLQSVLELAIQSSITPNSTLH